MVVMKILISTVVVQLSELLSLITNTVAQKAERQVFSKFNCLPLKVSTTRGNEEDNKL